MMDWLAIGKNSFSGTDMDAKVASVYQCGHRGGARAWAVSVLGSLTCTVVTPPKLFDNRRPAND